MAQINLDAKRAEREAARSEAKQKKHSFTLGGKKFELPYELPLEFAEHAYEGDLVGFVEAIVGTDQLEEFREQRPTLDDLKALAESMGEIYGVSLGE